MALYIPRQEISIEDIGKLYLVVQVLRKMGIVCSYGSEITHSNNESGPYLSDIMHEFNTRAKKAIILALNYINETPEDLTPKQFKTLMSFSELRCIRGCGGKTATEIYDILGKYD